MEKAFITRFLKLFNVFASLIVLVAFGLALYNYLSMPEIAVDDELKNRLKSQSHEEGIKLKFGPKGIELQLNKVIKNDYYELERVVDYGVEGDTGMYYLINLTHPELKEVTFFPAGEYTLNAIDDKLIESLNSVYTFVLDRLDSIEYKIYIEGEADLAGDKHFSRGFDSNYIFKVIQYHPSVKLKDDSWIVYSSSIETKYQSDTIKNKDLPLLRAAYLSQKLQRFEHVPKPEILEGGVKQLENEEYRNGKIYLYIGGPKHFAMSN